MKNINYSMVAVRVYVIVLGTEASCNVWNASAARNISLKVEIAETVLLKQRNFQTFLHFFYQSWFSIASTSVRIAGSIKKTCFIAYSKFFLRSMIITFKRKLFRCFAKWVLFSVINASSRRQYSRRQTFRFQETAGCCRFFATCTHSLLQNKFSCI